MGEIKCLLAIGSEGQINNLKRERGIRPSHSDLFSNLGARRETPLYGAIRMPTYECKHAIAKTDKHKAIRTTAELMDMLKVALHKNNEPKENIQNPTSLLAATTSSHSGESAPTVIEDESLITLEPSTSQAAVRLSMPFTNTPNATAANLNTPLKKPPLQFELSIKHAVGLTLNPGDRCKPGTNEPKRSASKRFPPGQPPSTYVTFQANDCIGSSGCYKSHEGNVYATDVVVRSLVPHWLQTFLVILDRDFLREVCTLVCYHFDIHTYHIISYHIFMTYICKRI